MKDRNQEQSELTLILRNPVARAVRHALNSQRAHLATSSVLTGALLLAVSTASAQEGVLEEITVTAQKREQNW